VSVICSDYCEILHCSLLLLGPVFEVAVKMLYLYALAVAGLLAWSFVSNRIALAKNIAAAKQTGLPIVVIPWYNFSTGWMILQIFIMPLLRKLPTSFTKPWLR
jgi:hypothetical protein